MVSPELIRRYPFFAGLSHDQIVTLAKAAEEIDVEAGHYFFEEESDLDSFYLVVEGEVAIVIQIPKEGAKQTVAGQYTRQLETTDVVVSTLGGGQVFGWSALVAPHKATAGGKATTRCRVVVFDSAQLLETFEDDPAFGYVMIEKAAQIIRGRLHDMRIESLANYVG